MKKKIFTTLTIMAASLLSSHADTLTVAMVGDIMMGTTHPTVMLPANDGADLFKDSKSILQRADLAVGNLEGVLCDGGTSTKSGGPGSYSFRMPTKYAPLLKEAGFDFLSMANNHANDFGLEGIESTERCLDEQGILYSGLAGRKSCAILQRHGRKIGICAFGHNHFTIRHINLDNVAHIVDSLASTCDIVIVSFHGGAEGRDKCHLPDGSESFLGENRGSIRELAHFCIDHGADIVYGHGPHVMRAVEVYKDRFIAYSLGNFCTPYNVSLVGISGQAPLMVVGIDENGRFLKGCVYPMTQTRGVGPRHDKTGNLIKQLRMLTECDVPHSQARIDEKGRILPLK